MKTQQDDAVGSVDGAAAAIATWGEATHHALREVVTSLIDGSRFKTAHGASPVPFSRAAATDYARLVELWNASRTATRRDLPPRHCPACASEQHHPTFKSYDGYQFDECEVCGTWFVPLAVDDSHIEQFFVEVPEARAIADKMMAGRDEHTRDADRARFSGYLDLVDVVLPAEGRRRRYLDIGCGVGHSIELAQERGFDAVGVELNRTAIETARSKGRNVHFPGSAETTGKFDVVSMFETLEHVTFPDKMMAFATEILAIDGILAITVPNGSGTETRVLRERCHHIFGGSESVGHINLFTPQGMERLLARYGMDLIFADGQFSNNPLVVVNAIISASRGAGPALQVAERDWVMPSSLAAALNNMGPYIAAFERAVLRSPILVCFACRKSSRSAMEAGIGRLRLHRQSSLLRDLPEAPQLERPATPSSTALTQDLRMHRGLSLLREARKKPHRGDSASHRASKTHTVLRQAELLPGGGGSGSSGPERAQEANLVAAEMSCQSEYLVVGPSVAITRGRYSLRARITCDHGTGVIGLQADDGSRWLTTALCPPGTNLVEAEVEITNNTEVRAVLAGANEVRGPVRLWLRDLELARLGDHSDTPEMG